MGLFTQNAVHATRVPWLASETRVVQRPRSVIGQTTMPDLRSGKRASEHAPDRSDPRRRLSQPAAESTQLVRSRDERAARRAEIVEAAAPLPDVGERLAKEVSARRVDGVPSKRRAWQQRHNGVPSNRSMPCVATFSRSVQSLICNA